ncbi:toll/interleukin-1 receptor domain-containing protein [Streptomyces sp. NBC_00076]|uniref:toll/interleukin-1 receptor domain-containing protein n=1 Tax=Streptomyces sp. NBC_00076 TaxID=2975642 RepID=UPI0032509888
MAADEKKIFISYRREDTAPYAGWLQDRLAQHYGASKVFMDVAYLQPGTDFPRIIGQAIATCDALIALIGTDWLGLTVDGNSRIQDPADWVRLEIESALNQGIRVIPLLVQGAQVPSPGALPSSLERIRDKNCLTLSYTTFSDDVRRLISALDFPTTGVFETSHAKRIERSRTSRFTEIDKIYRSLFDAKDLRYRHDPFIQPTSRRRQLDLLADTVDPDEDIAHLTLGALSTPESVGFMEAARSLDTRRALISLTQRRIIGIPWRKDIPTYFLPYAHILNVDRGISSITFTLAAGNVRMMSIKPLSKTSDMYEYIRDRLTSR